MGNNSILERAFTTGLMQWHRLHNRRTMPWKGEPDPYRIWLSEIILQQTRVEQGLGYYLRFTGAYPNVFSLAAAPDAEVFKLWEGLGYYSRCRNLLHTARTLVQDFEGIFPADYQKLVKLKGIGPYTAAAIASFGFGLPYAVLDGNVIRVLSRFFLLYEPFDTPAGKKMFQGKADIVLESSDPGAFNQAIMDFGATICKPALPQCDLCPLNKRCLAFSGKKVQDLPVRQKKAGRKNRYFAYLILRQHDRIWIRERTEKDIWRHLNEFFLVELPSSEALMQFDALQFCRKNQWQPLKAENFYGIFEQALTHQQIKSRFFLVNLPFNHPLPEEGKWVSVGDLPTFAFPKTITHFFSSAGFFRV
jgi:A/G-specific adenine glycosylase